MARTKWVRDGSIVTAACSYIDLRSTRKNRKTGEYDWITVKGSTDRRTEDIAAQLLDLLNGPPSEGRDGR